MPDPIPPPYRFQQVNFFEIQSPLLEFRKNITSQNGEDGIIQKIFETIKPENNYCVEFGAWNGKHLSNCCNLIENYDWAGCFIEAEATKFSELMRNHGTNAKVSCLHQWVEFEGQNSLDNILNSVNAPINLDVLSIDVDGTDFFIWQSLVEHKPNLVIIEFNPTIPNDLIFVQPKCSTIKQGCSLLSLILLGKEKGYELICCTQWNAFFVKSNFYPLFNIPNNSINYMYKPVYDGRIFHGFDSYIYVCGMPKLLWANIPVSSADFQVLPFSLRKFDES